MEEYQKMMEQRKAGFAEKNAESKRRIMKALKDNGIKTVDVEYVGSGDSGQIEDVTFNEKSSLDHMAESMTVVIFQRSSEFNGGEWEEKVEEKEVDLEEAVKELCYDILAAYHPGWEINDGSSGNLTFDVDGDTINLEHTNYFTESHTTEDEI